MSKPAFVIISDIHFTLNTLEVASRSLITAIRKAEQLGIPLVISGDLHDSKAIIRAEIANRLIEILSDAKCTACIIVGNHDLINEKGNAHSLNYLRSLDSVLTPVRIIEDAQTFYLSDVAMIPYMSDPKEFESIVSKLPSEIKIIICHQGFKGAWMGDYIQDKSSVDPAVIGDRTVITGHYHRHQTVITGHNGSITYVGNPYTLSFGEANDPEKGYLIVNEDGTFLKVPILERRHVVIETTTHELSWLDSDRSPHILLQSDILWLKVTGPQSELDRIDKKYWGERLLGHSNYKLTKICPDIAPVLESGQKTTDSELLDILIEAMPDSKDHKRYLKDLWRELW